MLFLTFNNANIKFAEKQLTWRSYIIAKPLLTTKQIEFINVKKFAKIALDKDFETFVIHVSVLKASITEMIIIFL